MSIDLRDLALRALHTWWQTFAASLGVIYAASAADLSQIKDIDSAKKVALALAGAVLAAALSALKTTIAGLSSGNVLSTTADPDLSVATTDQPSLADVIRVTVGDAITAALRSVKAAQPPVAAPAPPAAPPTPPAAG